MTLMRLLIAKTYTSPFQGAGITNGSVCITILGEHGDTGRLALEKPAFHALPFERGQVYAPFRLSFSAIRRTLLLVPS